MDEILNLSPLSFFAVFPDQIIATLSLQVPTFKPKPKVIAFPWTSHLGPKATTYADNTMPLEL